jgi:hypothetical protein
MPSRNIAVVLLLAILTFVGIWTFRNLRRAPLPLEPAISGQVTGPHGPIAEARVRWQAQTDFTLTDSSGRFALPKTANTKRITAWKKGFFIGSAEFGRGVLTIRLTPLPGKDNEKYQWVDPTPGSEKHACANCHAEIFREWSTSQHARSVTGYHFRNLYEGTARDGKTPAGWGLLRDHPDGAGVCASCHAPTVRDDDPALFDLTRAKGVNAQGVHCDYCHKIAETAIRFDGRAHGRFNLDLLRPKEGQLFFGPLDDSAQGDDALLPLYRDSRYCASCHEGVVFGVPVYTTYSEWLASPARKAGKHCQDCHMTPTGKMTNFAPGHGGVERDPRTLANHRFFQGSLQEMLRDCLKVKVTVSATPKEIISLVRLEVEGAGHAVPTGFVDRHLLLIVECLGADNRRLSPRAGPILPSAAGPTWEGKAGRLYAKLLKGLKGNSPAPFWRAEPRPNDTRLLPGKSDETKHSFPPGVMRIRVRILYRRFWEEDAQRKGWPNGDLVIFEKTYSTR